LIPIIARLFRGALLRHSLRRRQASLKDLAQIRGALLQCLDDCHSPAARRLQSKIAQARNPQELWMLRNDVYQVISQHHDQSVAAERINGILRVFEGWLDPKQIVRIK
jgi:hypothetical protein